MFMTRVGHNFEEMWEGCFGASNRTENVEEINGYIKDLDLQIIL